MSLLARALCTMTWSEHQYQMLEIARPKVIPDQGRSELCDLSSFMASSGGFPQSSVPLGVIGALMLAVALKYFSIKLS